MRLTLKNQKGFTLTPALFILSLIMIAGTIYLLYINSSGKAVRKIETANIAKYAAEVGLLQMKSQFAQLNVLNPSQKVINKWYNAKAFDYSSSNKYIFESPITNELLRSEVNTPRMSKYIELKDTSGKISSSYRITIEDGSFLPDGKTSTGSATQGKDKYGNSIWSDATNKNFNATQAYYRYGVKVDGFSHDSAGNREKSSQSIYAVIDVPNIASTEVFQNWTAGSPAGFLLSTDGYEAPTGSTSERYLNLLSGQVITGKIHSNNKLIFNWEGNWDTGTWDNWNTAPSIIPFRNSINNDNHTVFTGRYSTGTTDPSPVLIKKVVREQSASANRLTIYGLNFSTNLNKNLVTVNNIPVLSSSIEIAEYTQPKFPPAIPNDIPTNIVTRMRITVPAGVTLPYTISIKNEDIGQTVWYKVKDISVIDDDDALNKKETPIRIYGIMQVKVDNKTPYKGGFDYELIGPPIYNYFNGAAYFYTPYINWKGSKPAGNSNYSVTYLTENNIPHNKIKVYNNITYSGSPIPVLKYIHSHKVEGSSGFSFSPFSDTHKHSEVFGISGVSLDEANAPLDYFRNAVNYYDWEYYHQHSIPSSLLSYNNSIVPYIYQNDSFFYWDNISFRPTSVAPKVAPILYPNNVNFNKQRTYADQLLKIMLNKNLSKDANDNLNSLDEIPEDRSNGYYNLNGSTLDLRATYFGNDLKYSAGTKIGQEVLPIGSPLDLTAPIYVDDSPSSSTYMQISDAQTSSTFKSYTYRQIPKNGPILSTDGTTSTNGGIIFARNGVIRIGGAGYKGIPENYSVYNIGSTFGNNTIIDGSLTIVSYSEEKPTVYINSNSSVANDNKGDIVITGNIIYKNRIWPKESEIAKKSYTYNGFRQYKSSISNSNTPVEADYITDTNAKVKSETGMPTGEKVNGLALIASNDIKIPVAHYNHLNMEKSYTTPIEEANTTKGCPCKDTITIYGQLIAGHKITQTKVDDHTVSKNDRIVLYGSFYSDLPPNLAYFGRSNPDNTDEDGLGRMYLYDKTLAEMPLAGTPRFPKDDSYNSESYPVVGTSLPRIVPGTWKVVSDGAQ